MTTLNDNIVNNLFETANAIDGERYLPNADEYVPDAIERVIAHTLTSEREAELVEEVEEESRGMWEESRGMWEEAGFDNGHDAAHEHIYSEHIVIDDEYINDRIPDNWNFGGNSKVHFMDRIRDRIREDMEHVVDEVILQTYAASMQDDV